MNPVEAVLAGMSARSKMQREDEDAADRDLKRKQDAEDRAHTMSERQRAIKLREQLAAATGPAVVGQAEQAGPVDPTSSIPAAAQPLPTLPTVNGKTFQTPEAASDAASAYNSPQSMAARQAQVLAGAGEAKAAQDIRTAAMQEQSAQLKLNADEQAELDRRFNEDVESKVTDFDTLGMFVSKSAGDGVGGRLKVQMVPSADNKKITMNVVMPDGTLKPTEKQWENTQSGFLEAKELLKRTSPDKKLAHLYQKASLERQEQDSAERARHNKEMERLTGDKTAAQIEMAGMRAAVAAAKQGAAGQPGGLTIADLKDGHKSIASTLNADWKAQIEATTDPAQLKAIKVSRENEIATVQRLYTGAMSAGFAMTPEQAIVAFRTGTVGTQSFKSKDGRTVSVEGIQYGGRFIPLADNPGAALASAQPTAPAAGKAPAAPSAAGKGMAPAPQQDEPPAERVKQTPVYDFSGSNSAVNKRVSAAQEQIPALQQAVAAAQKKVQEAASRGPMAVAAARNDLSNARTALAEMMARAGQ